MCENEEETPDMKSAVSRNSGMELSVLLAEYQMLTARNTQWLALQNGIWPVLLAVVALLLRLVPAFHLWAVIWLAFIAFEVAVLGYSGIGMESYNNVFYIESRIRPRVRALTRSQSSLNYESFLHGHRPMNQGFFDYSLPIILTLGLVLAVILHKTFPGYPLAWIAAITVLVIANWVLAWRAASCRAQFLLDQEMP